VAKRICSECSNRLERSTQKTCSTACRSKRARRLKKQRLEASRKGGENNALPEHLAPLSAAVSKNAKQVAHEILKEEMKPVVREAITEDVLNAINDLVALTPTMVAAIKDDLASDDKYLRQKAYSLLARYTLGNSSVAPAPATAAPGPMQVVFQLPRPGDDGAPSITVEAEELRTCMECQATKPASEFVANSERCQACHDALQEKVRARFA
jgi:hypothetical protein